jgi:hypothetical protein
MQPSSKSDDTPKESSHVYDAYTETYESIYDLHISQNIDRPPSYREEYEHEYGKIKKEEDSNTYVELIDESESKDRP